jgi:hypothetical protein
MCKSYVQAKLCVNVENEDGSMRFGEIGGKHEMQTFLRYSAKLRLRYSAFR